MLITNWKLNAKNNKKKKRKDIDIQIYQAIFTRGVAAFASNSSEPATFSGRMSGGFLYIHSFVPAEWLNFVFPTLSVSMRPDPGRKFNWKTTTLWLIIRTNFQIIHEETQFDFWNQLKETVFWKEGEARNGWFFLEKFMNFFNDIVLTESSFQVAWKLLSQSCWQNSNMLCRITLCPVCWGVALTLKCKKKKKKA